MQWLTELAVTLLRFAEEHLPEHNAQSCVAEEVLASKVHTSVIQNESYKDLNKRKSTL